MEITMAMITTTTRISTSVKPRAHRARIEELLRIEGRAADIRIIAVPARFAVPAKGHDLVGFSVRSGAGVLIRVIPWILRHSGQVSLRPILRNAGVRGLLHQRRQP